MAPRPPTRLLRAIIALIGAMILVSLVTSTAPAAQPPADEPPVDAPVRDAPAPRTDAFQDTFTERHPLSAIASMKARMRFATSEPAPEYDLAEESFEIYVPPTYDPARRYGLIVWVSPTNSGSPLPHWLPVLDQHDLIWVGANNAGNERIGWYRFGLALDAAFNMEQRYAIDPERIYISGMSGGGRVSSRVGVAYADVFDGAFMIVGCDFYKRTPVADQPGKVYIERYQAPPGKILAKAIRENRYVLLTGTADFNRTETIAIYEHGFTKEKFAHATYLEVPGMAHAYPDAIWFEKGIDALDTPLFDRRAQLAQATREHESAAADALAHALATFQTDPVAGYLELVQVAQRFDETPAGREARQRADSYAADPANLAALEQARARDEAVQLLSLIDAYVAAGRPDLAREKLNLVIELVPGTDLAEQARKRLAELDR